MGVKQKVSISVDVTTPVLPFAASVHKYICVPPNPAVPYAVHFDCPVSIFWAPGYALGQNKLTSSVKHASMGIAQESHDCGALIAHCNIVPPAPINILLAIHMPFSKRPMMFSASTVKMDGAPVGTSDLLSIPTPMLVCADPFSLPTAFPVTNATNTVNVGMTAGDFLAGYVAIGLTMAAEFLARSAPSATGTANLWKSFFQKAVWKDWRSFLLKAAAAILGGTVKALATGQGGISIGIGSPFGGIKISAKVGNNGNVTVTVERSILGAKGKVDVDEHGKASVQGEQPLFGKTKKTPLHGPSMDAGSARSALLGGEEPL